MAKPMKYPLCAALFTWCCMASSPAISQEAAFNTDGYRVAHYRGPITHAPEGAHRIAKQAAASLRPDKDALFIDVTPAEGGIRQSDGRWHLARVKYSIPGAHWFPEAGRGEPDPAIARWFDIGIARLSHHRSNRMMVLFCLADCWMSWNAARRLAANGYSNIWWLAEGSDGWTDMALPLAPIVPER